MPRNRSSPGTARLMDLALPERYILNPEVPILGEGGMGRVLRVHDRVLDVPVAMKVVKPELARDRRFTSRFEVEVRMAARFAHPHIVPLHDLGTLPDGTPYLGLAYADSGNLSVISRSPVGWAEIQRLSVELLSALAHLHARGVLHRDLKPEDILLHRGPDGERHVWLADLGLADVTASMARDSARREGTPGYMAPEQRLGLVREMGPATDLYVVAVLIWQMVSGRLPFLVGTSALDSALKPLVTRPGLVVPDGLETVLQNALSADPLSRYDIAADMRTELLSLEDIDDLDAPTDVCLGRTVAPAAPRPHTVLSSLSVVATGTTEARDATDWLTEPPGHARHMEFDVPNWNRPKPFPLPEQPVHSGLPSEEVSASLALFSLREVPLVARDGERDELWTLANEVASTRKTWVVFVIGEAGTGKTALCEDILRDLEEGGWAHPMRMRWNDPAGLDDGFAGAARALIRPWNETRYSLEARMNRRIARAHGCHDRLVSDEAQMLARWVGLCQPGEAPVPVGYGLREIHRELDARSWRPLSALLLDDIHNAADEGDGLDIVEGFLQRAQDGRERPLLVVATVRREALDRDPSLAARIRSLQSDGAVSIELSRLDEAGTAALLANSLALEPELAEQLGRRCEGNPLFARQLIVEWAARGWMVDTGDLRFGLAHGVDLDDAVPEDAATLFTERFDALIRRCSDEVRFTRTVYMAAIAGMRLPTLLVKNLAETPENWVDIENSGLWRISEEHMAFDHGLLHATMRGLALEQAGTAGMHRRLAEAWKSYGVATGRDVSWEIGRHAFDGKRMADASESLLRCCMRAWNAGAGQRLQEASELAVEATRAAGGRDYALALLWHARAAQMQGRNGDASGQYRLALEQYQKALDRKGVMDVLVGLGRSLCDSGDLAGSQEVLHEALAKARGDGDPAVEAEVLAALGWLEQKKCNFGGADLLFTRVLNRAVNIGDVRLAASAALGQAGIAQTTGRFKDAEDLYEEATEGFHQGEDPLGVARAQLGLACTRRQQLQLSVAEELFHDVIRASEALGATPLLMEARVGMADLHRSRGDFARARQVYQACARWAERQNVFDRAILAHLSLAHIALLEDDLSAMYRHARHAAVHLERVPGHWLWARYRLVVATLLALRRDRDEAYRWLWSAADLGIGDTVDQDNAYFLTVLVHLAASMGWPSIVSVAGKLAREQWERLGRPREAARVARAIRLQSKAS